LGFVSLTFFSFLFFVFFSSFAGWLSAGTAVGFSLDSPSLKPSHSSPLSSADGFFRIDFLGFPSLAYEIAHVLESLGPLLRTGNYTP
jgi:hypothetical protein